MGLTSRQIAIIALLFLVNVLNYLDRQVLSVLAPVLRKEIGLSQMQYAMAVNSFLAAYAVMYAGSGMVLDRLGARIGLAFFVTAWSIASGLHAAVAGFAGLAAFRFLLGLTEPGGWTGTIKAIAERFNPLQRGLVTGIAISGASVAERDYASAGGVLEPALRVAYGVPDPEPGRPRMVAVMVACEPPERSRSSRADPQLNVPARGAGNDSRQAGVCLHADALFRRQLRILFHLLDSGVPDLGQSNSTSP